MSPTLSKYVGRRRPIWRTVHNNEDCVVTMEQCILWTLVLSLLLFIKVVININLSVACPGVSCNLIWAASPSDRWGQLKPFLHMTVKRPLQALTQPHPEIRTSWPPWRSGSCLDLASIDTCHCQACRRTHDVVLLILFNPEGVTWLMTASVKVELIKWFKWSYMSIF